MVIFLAEKGVCGKQGKDFQRRKAVRNMLKKELNYPISSQTDTEDIIHGVHIPDPYRWLENLDSESTKKWITEQNEVTFDFLKRIKSRNNINQRITELWNYEKYSPFFKRGGRYFYVHNDGLQDQFVLYWMESLTAEPKVLLDPNSLSEDGTLALTNFSVSENGKLLAYGLSASGSDWQEWHVRDIDTGQDLSDHLAWVKFSGAAWTHNTKGFFYSRYDEPVEGTEFKGANYNQKLYYHRIGTLQSDDILIYERPDQKEWGFMGKVSDDGRYLLIIVWKGTHRENCVFYKDLRTDDDKVIELISDFDAKYEFIDNDGTVFYLLTDYDAPMSKVIAIDATNPKPSEWIQIIHESEDVLRSVSLINDKFVATYLHDAHSLVKIFSTTGQFISTIELPAIGSVVGFEGRRNDRETFYFFTGFTTPGSVYRYDMVSGESEQLRKPKVEFNPDYYIVKQVFYQSKDGTKVPMFITHKKDLELDGNNPTYLYGYGGFDISLTPAFSISNLVWMELGGVYAQPNLRGGGEYGKSWHEAGMKLSKQNVFDDFIAAAEWLIENKYTRSPKLAIGGGSNGGLLVGACMTQRPELFSACISDVGVFEMLRFHKFTIGWAWTSDYGSPDDPEEFKLLSNYSPYHNIDVNTSYPATLLLTGDHDDRVFPAHSFKFAAALQTTRSENVPILIRIETKAGHGMGKPTHKIIEALTDKWAFLVDILEMEHRSNKKSE